MKKQLIRVVFMTAKQVRIAILSVKLTNKFGDSLTGQKAILSVKLTIIKSNQSGDCNNIKNI